MGGAVPTDAGGKMATAMHAAAPARTITAHDDARAAHIGKAGFISIPATTPIDRPFTGHRPFARHLAPFAGDTGPAAFLTLDRRLGASPLLGAAPLLDAAAILARLLDSCGTLLGGCLLRSGLLGRLLGFGRTPLAFTSAAALAFATPALGRGLTATAAALCAGAALLIRLG